MPIVSTVRGSFGSQGRFGRSTTIRASGGTISSQSIGGVPYTVHTFDYTGSDQTFTMLEKGITGKIIAKVWGAAGGAGTYAFNTFGGPGGYGTATINTSALGFSFPVVVGQGGRTSSGERSTYGHINLSTDGRPGGFGASCGDGGGLSGIFNTSTTHSNSILIAGGGGGSGQIISSRLEGAGGPGGGPNQNGVGGYDGSSPSSAFGRGGTTTAGGQAGIRFFVSGNGLASVSVATDGSALCGGHAHTISNWTEGGGGGSGYYGGGSGAHEETSSHWGTAGGGSGYANTSVCSNITAFTGSYEAQNSNATNDIHWASGISVPNGGTSGGNGRVVIMYPTSSALA
jgi:hypothetical protein